MSKKHYDMLEITTYLDRAANALSYLDEHGYDVGPQEIKGNLIIITGYKEKTSNEE